MKTMIYFNLTSQHHHKNTKRTCSPHSLNPSAFLEPLNDVWTPGKAFAQTAWRGHRGLFTSKLLPLDFTHKPLPKFY